MLDLNTTTLPRNIRLLLSGSIVRAYALATQLIVFAVAALIMPKFAFGDLMMAFGLIRVLSVGLGGGLASLLLYHTARETNDEARQATQTSIAMVALLLGIALSCLMLLGAQHLSQALGKPSLEPWLTALSPLLLFTLVSTALVGALDGQGRIISGMMLMEAGPNTLRLILFGIVYLLAADAVWVAHALWFSVAIPASIACFHIIRFGPHKPALLGAWDVRFASKYTVNAFAALQLQGVDLVIAGLLLDSNSTAEYAIASRVAALFPFLMQLSGKIFTARAGKMIAAGQITAVRAEAVICKLHSIVAVFATTGLALLLAPLFLSFLGQSYGGSNILILLLTYPAILRSFFAPADRVLHLNGHADWSMWIMICSFVIVCLLPFVLAPRFGAGSIPIAMMISSTILNPVIAYAVRKTSNLRLISWIDIIIVGIVGCGVIAGYLHHEQTFNYWLGSAYLSIGALFIIRRLYIGSSSVGGSGT